MISPSSSLIFRRPKKLASFFAATTMSYPWGKRDLLSLKNSLIRRLTLFLLTAFPVFLPTVTPSLEMPSPFCFKMTTKCLEWRCMPDLFRLTKSIRFNILILFGNEKDSMRLRKIDRNCKAWLDGYSFPPLCPSSSQDINSAFRSHSCSEAMSSCPLDIAGLICPFHCIMGSF